MTNDLAGLVVAARDGDRSAFDELVRLTYADAFTLARRLTGNEEDARDVVQEAYLRAFKGLKNFRGESQFSTWMHRITANCAMSFLARGSKRRTDALPEDDTLVDTDERHDPVARAESLSELSRVSEALDELPPQLRAVVVLRDVYELPHEAIAAELGISEAAAKVRLHRARRKLRERLFPLRGEESARAV